MRRQRSLAPRSPTVLVHALLVLAAGAVLWGLGSPAGAQTAGGTAQILTAPDVTAVITAAAQALSDDTMAVAVGDPAGPLLGVYPPPRAGAPPPPIAGSPPRATPHLPKHQAPPASPPPPLISRGPLP